MASNMTDSPLFRSVALVVDDDQSTCDVVAAILEQEGFTVVTANSAEEALEHFGVHVFDIVFTDVCMDGMSGLELLERIPNMDPAIKTVIMTAHGGFDVVLQALKGGAYDYIEKPIDDHARIASMARKAQAHAILERDNVELLSKLKTSHKKLADANAQLTELNKKLESLAVTDGLTGLKNRRFIDAAVKKEIALYRRYNNPFSMLMLDVDHFKVVNDQFGHKSGDRVLCELAKILADSSRLTDTVGRLGGEEFFLLLHGTTVVGAEIVARRILDQVRQLSVEVEEGVVNVTVSIGIAGIDGVHNKLDPEQVMGLSDKALYRAKDNGRDKIEVITNGTDHDRLVA